MPAGSFSPPPEGNTAVVGSADALTKPFVEGDVVSGTPYATPRHPFTTAGAVQNLRSWMRAVAANVLRSRRAQPGEIDLTPETTFATALTLTAAAHEGRTLRFTGSAPLTQPLPALAGIEDGLRLRFLNAGTATLTLDPNGAELIGGNATLDVPPGVSVTIERTAAAGWRHFGADAIARVPGLSAGNFLMVIDGNGRISGGAAVPDVSNISQGRRQCVQHGPVNASGFPSWFPATGASLTLTATGISSTSPLVVVASNGAESRVARLTANPAWTLTGSALNYVAFRIAADGTVTTRVVTLAPIVIWSGAPATTNGQYTFVISEMRMYLGNGTIAEQVWDVIVGQANAAAGSFSAGLAYAHEGRAYVTGVAVPAAGGLAAFAHNLGIPVFSTAAGALAPQITLWLVCGTGEHGYLPGARLEQPLSRATTVPIRHGVVTGSATTFELRTGFNQSFVIATATTGENANITPANWTLAALFDRGW